MLNEEDLMVVLDMESDQLVSQLWQHEAVLAARQQAAMRFRLAHGVDVPEEAWASFDEAMDEWVTNYLRKAVAFGAAGSRFVALFLPPRSVGGNEFPGARMGGDNPDNLYRLAAIEHGGRYRVSGRRVGTAPANTSFTLVGNWGTSVTHDGLESDALQLDADGRFEITIDSETSDRSNHLTTQPDTKFLFVRDTMADWEVEHPYELEIERLDKPSAELASVDVLAKAAAFRLVEDVPLYFWFHRLFSARPRNVLDPPTMAGDVGGLVTQAGAQAQIRLQPGQCALLRFRDMGAAYSALQLTDWWFRSIRADLIQSTITHAQATPNKDGWYEVVISPEDPGVANWLDTDGLLNVLLIARWQGLAPGSETPKAEMEIVDIASIDPASGIAGGPLDSEGRAAQYRARQAAWVRRF